MDARELLMKVLEHGTHTTNPPSEIRITNLRTACCGKVFAMTPWAIPSEAAAEVSAHRWPGIDHEPTNVRCWMLSKKGR